MLDWALDCKAKKYYSFVEEIGRGSYGNCYLSIDEVHTFLACKICAISPLFDDEIKLHSELQHKNVVKFINSFNFNKMSYLILELCNLGTVSDLLKCRESLTDAEVKYITNQTGQGLIYLHENLILHRDLKLTNLLISSQMTIKISDFGLSTKLQAVDEIRDTICGTPNYMAPEIKSKKGYRFGVDIWSLGCIVFTLLNGKEPVFCEGIYSKTKNIVKLPLVSTTKIRQPAWKFLKTIFVPPAQRPSAKTVCLHPYLSSPPSLYNLEVSSFYKEPNIQSKTSLNFKSRALRDRTNSHHKSAAEICKINPLQGKENYVVPKMKLRSQKRFTKYVLPLLQESITIRGSSIAKNLLDNTLMLLEIESSDWYLEKRDVSFVNVRRWVAGLTAFGYETSDGGLGVIVNDNVHIHQTIHNQHENKLYQIDGEKQMLEGTFYRDIVSYTKRCLESLPPSGPTCPYQTPILVVAKKLFKLNDSLSSNPTVAFLLSNGTCQVNFANHEKLIVNCFEDILVLWNQKDVHSCSLGDLGNFGIPFYLQNKIQIMCYFLSNVAHL